MKDNIPCPCGKCIPCLINRKRLWTHRIILESLCHEQNAFVTLTYDDPHLPVTHPETGEPLTEATLNPKHLKNFIKRLRQAVKREYGAKLRFYAVGEYGDRSWRPHYHIALFGYPPCWHGQTRKEKHSKGFPCCPPCDLILKTWNYKETGGGIDNANVENDSAGYIAGYVTKKLTKDDNPKLKGRYPEFARQSNRPGIGAPAMEKIYPLLNGKFGQNMLTEHGDVPISLKYGKRSLPLGKYLRQQLRKNSTLPEVYDKETGEIKYEGQVNAQQSYKEELLSLWMDNLKDEKASTLSKVSTKWTLLEKDKQKIKNTETKHNLNKRTRNL